MIGTPNTQPSQPEISPQRKEEIKEKLFFIDKMGSYQFSYRRADKLLSELEQVKKRLAQVELENQRLHANNYSKARETEKRILDFVTSTGNTSTRMVSEKLKINKGYCSTVLNRLVKRGELVKLHYGLFAPVKSNNEA